VLLRFGVSNYLSILDHQSLSLIATALTDTNADLLTPNGLGRRVLPALALYGANASGKTNILAAFQFLKRAVVESQTRGDASGGLNLRKFALKESARSEPSTVDCDMWIDGTRYHYGFTASEDEFLSEWLYSYPKRRRRVEFFREGDQITQAGESMGGEAKLRLLQSLMRKNSLFISVGAQNNVHVLSTVYNWFATKTMRFSSTSSPDLGLTTLLGDADSLRVITDFVKSADLGITGLELETTKLSDETRKFGSELFEFFRKQLDSRLELRSPFQDEFPEEYKEIVLLHSGETHDVSLSQNLESAGTLKLLRLLGPVLTTIRSGGVLFVDEMEANFHPLLTIKLLKMFTSTSTNPNGAQIIFSTHDTNVLCSGIFRRDQIWFVEKARDGASHYYALSDLATRKSDSFERGYLEGRYGAIPFFGQLDALLQGST